MGNLVHINVTGLNIIDKTLGNLVEIFEGVFPGRIRGYYLAGSYADHSHVSSSDVDLFVIFKGSFEPEEETKARWLGRCYAQACPVDLELPIGDEVSLHGVNPVALKTNSVLVYGEDMRDQISLPAMSEYVRRVTQMPPRYCGVVLRRQNALTFPLTYPAPGAAFYGYTLPANPGEEQAEAGTKWLVVSVCWIATALVAIQAGRYVGSKSQCAGLYREYIQDEWADFVEAAYGRCKLEWGYHIPQEFEQREYLASLCCRALAFENHYFSIYHDYLLSELQSGNQSRQHSALVRLMGVIYPDEAISAAIEVFLGSDNIPLKQAAMEIRGRIQSATTRTAKYVKF